jgi:CHAT domain-containing protein
MRLFGVFILLFCFSNNSYCQLWKQYADSAKTYRSQKDYDAATEYYIKAKNILLKDSMLSDSYIQVSGNLSDVYFSVNNYDSAEALYLQIAALTERLHGKNETLATILDKLGRLYATKAKYGNAEKFFMRSSVIKQTIFTKQSLEYAASCTYLANVYTSTGQYEKADSLYIEGKAIRENLLPKDSAGYAQLCNNLANLYRETGQYEKAEPLALLAKQIRGQLLSGKDSASISNAYAISCTNLANLYRDMGQYDKSEALYLEAKQIREKIPPFKGSAAYASSCNILADLYYFKSDYKKAEALYLEAKQVREKIFTRQSSDYAQSCNNLATLYTEMGEYAHAEPLALEANRIWISELQPDDPALAASFENLGLLSFHVNKYQEAKSYFYKARQIWMKTSGKDNPAYTLNSLDLARVFWSLNEMDNANDYYVEAFNLQNEQIKKIFRFTSEAEKNAYMQNISGSVDEYHSFYLQAFNHNTAGEAFTIALLSRNLTLTATQKLKQIIYSAGDPVLNKKYDEWMILKKQTGALYLKNDTSKQKIKVLQDRANDLEKDLFRNSAAFKNELQTNITWQNIQQKLKPGEAAIEFTDFNFYDGKRYSDSTFYIALVLKKDKPEPQLIKLFEKRQLAELFNKTDNVNDLYHQNTSLYKLIWKPLEKYLTNISKIYFAPGGDLFKISFAAIPFNNERTLGDKYRLIQLNTTASAADKNQNFITAADKIQLYGGIVYNADTAALKEIAFAYHSYNETSRSLPNDLIRSGSIQYLPGSQAEVQEIKAKADKATTSVTILSGINATEESFKALNGQASPSILHIATHGFFFPDPKGTDSIQRKFERSGKIFKQSDDPLFRSGLLFAGADNAWRGKPVSGIEDGIVTAYDVANMYLPNTKLVVLSACETALGDIQGSEGVYGLQRAFKIAGAQSLLMSLWKVPDAETSEFMQLFYGDMFNNQSVSDAFYHAQTIMKNKYRNDPYKWAAWVLVR